MNIGEDVRNLIAFTSTLVAIVLLSWLGGSGADLAIMTGLVGVLGMLARPARAQQPPNGNGTLEPHTPSSLAGGLPGGSEGELKR